MTWSALIQCSLFLGLVLALAIPLGAYIAGIYAGKRSGLARWLRPVELMLHRVVGIQEEEEMSWSQYAFAFLQFQVLGILLVVARAGCSVIPLGCPDSRLISLSTRRSALAPIRTGRCLERKSYP